MRLTGTFSFQQCCGPAPALAKKSGSGSTTLVFNGFCWIRIQGNCTHSGRIIWRIRNTLGNGPDSNPAALPMAKYYLKCLIRIPTFNKDYIMLPHFLLNYVIPIRLYLLGYTY